MKIVILGADGYLGWPTVLYFSNKGYDVIAVDNYLKRQITEDIGVSSLTPTPFLENRAKAWKEASAKTIEVRIGDVCDYNFLSDLIRTEQPDAIIHYAEQPSAPYSMMGHKEAALTLQNNLMSTLNIAYAIHEFAPNCHIVKLGTMGEYGTPNIDIEEGWLEVEHNGRKDNFLFPRQASSLYHTTKIQDTDLLWFYVRTWQLKVTDLMQGPVYGTFTDETSLNPFLAPSFFYDEVFGTVVNRFVVQSVCEYPLTVYGSGTQTRGYLDIRNTLDCLGLAVEFPPSVGELRIFNQITETFSVKEIAEKVKQVGKLFDLDVKIKSIENPRTEKESHYYNPKYTGLINLGLKPRLMSDENLAKMFVTAMKYKDRINQNVIFKGIKWN
jgi:UDP-sulfoquinovose synthase